MSSEKKVRTIDVMGEMGFISFDKSDVRAQVTVACNKITSVLRIVRELDMLNDEFCISIVKFHGLSALVIGAKDIGIIIAPREDR